MDDFVLEREKYYKRLSIFSEQIEKLNENKTKKELVKMLVFPEDFEQLKLADAYLDCLTDVKDFRENVLSGNIKEISLENNIYIDYLVLVYNLTINNTSEEELKETIKNYYISRGFNSEEEFYATVMCHLLIGLRYEIEAMICLLERCNLDPEDDLSVLRLQVVLAKAFENTDMPTVDINDPDSKISFIKFINHFHDISSQMIITKNKIN